MAEGFPQSGIQSWGSPNRLAHFRLYFGVLLWRIPAELSSALWWLDHVRLYSVEQILYSKGAYNLTLYWALQYPQIKHYSAGVGRKPGDQAVWDSSCIKYGMVPA